MGKGLKVLSWPGLILHLEKNEFIPKLSFLASAHFLPQYNREKWPIVPTLTKVDLAAATAEMAPVPVQGHGSGDISGYCCLGGEHALAALAQLWCVFRIL